MTNDKVTSLLAACLLLAGCSGSGGPATAEEVEYDPAKAGLDATHVQGALDEAAGRVAALEEGGSARAARLEAAEAEIAILKAAEAPAAADVAYDPAESGLGVQSVQAALDAVSARASESAAKLDALGAKGVAYRSGTPGEETVYEALGSLKAALGKCATKEELDAAKAELAAAKVALAAAGEDLAETAAELAALKAKTDPDSVKCPEGMLDVWTFCIDGAPRTPPMPWSIASSDCTHAGYSLCTPEQHYSACGPYGAVFAKNPPEITAEHASMDTILMLHQCDMPTVIDALYDAPYRCCVEKAALVYAKKAGE